MTGFIEDSFLPMFSKWAHRQVEIAKGQPQESTESYVLALTALEALAFFEGGDQGKLSVAFADFVVRYSGMSSIYQKVSVPLLAQEIRLRRSNSLGYFADWLTQHYSLVRHYKNKVIRQSSDDPDLVTLKNAMDAENVSVSDKAIGLIETFTYSRLLYSQYRSRVVHRRLINNEARKFRDETEPHYMNEQTGFPRFECGRLGISCLLEGLPTEFGIEHFTPDLIVEVLSNTGKRVEAMPTDIIFHPPQWESNGQYWKGAAEKGGEQFEWLMAEITVMSWITFGIPLAFIFVTLEQTVSTLCSNAYTDPALATRLYHNVFRRD